MSEQKIKKPSIAWVVIGFLVTIVLFATSLDVIDKLWYMFVIFIVADISALVSYLNKMKIYRRRLDLPDEIRQSSENAVPLETPAKIVVVRDSSVIGMAISYKVYINGDFAGKLGNGKVLETETLLAHNIVMVTDHQGNPFKGEVVADLTAGGYKEIHVKAGRFKTD